MNEYPKITLEQWRALVAVVDHGGYAQAAQALSKTQSSVSYAVHKMEQLLGVALFQIQGRKALLTAAGGVLVRRGRELVEQAGAIERAARHLGAGWEAEIRLTVEVLFPTWELLQVIDQFGRQCPQTRVELYESVLGGTDEALLERRVDLAVCSNLPPGFHGEPLRQIKLIPVAAPAHPLHQLKTALTHADLRAHRQILIRDSGSARTRSGGWQRTEQRLTVSNKATAIRALCMGMGFAWQAELSIRDELRQGVLRPLPMAQDAARHVWLHLVQTDGELAGPATVLMAQLLRQTVEPVGASSASESDAHTAE